MSDEPNTQPVETPEPQADESVENAAAPAETVRATEGRAKLPDNPDADEVLTPAQSEAAMRKAFEQATGSKAVALDDDEVLLPEPVEDGPEDEEADAGEDDAPGKDDGGFDEAVRAFKRDGHAEDSIQKYLKAVGRETFLAEARGKAKRQADVDARLMLKALGKPGDSDSPDGDPAAGSAQDPLAADISKLIEDSVMDDEAATKLRATFKALSDQLAGERSTATELQRKQVAQMWATAVGELSASIPLVDTLTAEQVKSVAQVMQRLDPETKAIADQAAFTKLAGQAVAAVFHDQIIRQKRESVVARTREARQGQMTTKTALRSTGGLSKDGFELAAYRAVKRSGGDPARLARESALLKARRG